VLSPDASFTTTTPTVAGLECKRAVSLALVLAVAAWAWREFGRDD
jgi:hypothetical protein